MKHVALYVLLCLLPLSFSVEVQTNKCNDSNTCAEKSETVSLEDLQWAAKEGQNQVEALIQLEKELIAQGLTATKKRPGHSKRSLSQKRNSIQSRRQTLKALAVTEASKKLKERLNLSADEALNLLPKLSLKGTALEASCVPPNEPCEDTKYRSIDGSCNNFFGPFWGQSGTSFTRFVPPQYGDGISSLRSASDGTELPNPREAINVVISNYGRDDFDNVTLALMSFGQFVTHDLALSEDFTFEDGSNPACCNSVGLFPRPGEMHPQCASIELINHQNPESPSGCMSVTRTKTGSDYSCTFGYAQQLNGNTHFLDGSQIYGSDAVTMNELREGMDGLMKTTRINGRQLPPIAPGCEDILNHEKAVCFQAGDVRVEENPQLTALHVIMLREHNRVARQLKAINPQRTDEIVFQETRRIIVAQLQHITYNEYLPILLGPKAMEDYKLWTPATGFGTGYSADVNPSISNDFTSGAFRITHSSIQGYLTLFNEADEEDDERSFSLSHYFFDASRLMDDEAYLDSIIRGFTKQVPQKIDVFYSTEIVFNLYSGNDRQGGDLVSITIQRGREHGLPGYNSYREMCGLPKAQTFDDLANEIYEEDFLDTLKRYYKSVDDIDLYFGCLSETHVPGGKMGPVCACIVANQFSNLKVGDRFFYDRDRQLSSFTLEQLDQIRKSSLARLMCDNNDGTVTSMQPAALRTPIGSNAKVPCSSIPSIDLSLWKEA